MKKQLLLFVMILLPMVATSETVEIDGIYYNLILKTKEAEVARGGSYSGNIIIPEKISYGGDEYIVKFIGELAFYGCYDLYSVKIPNSVSDIKDIAFIYCYNLVSVELSENITSINYGVFDSCKNLESLTIPNNVTSINTIAFRGCTKLSSIVIPSNVTYIGQEAFNNCTGLIKVILGNGINNINTKAFANCTSLADVYCYAEKVPNISDDAFKDSYTEYTTLHVPASAVDAYKAATPWSNFKEIVALTNDDPQPTGIDKIVVTDNSKSVFYDLNGRRVDNPSKGIYIKNGKKYVVK